MFSNKLSALRDGVWILMCFRVVGVENGCGPSGDDHARPRVVVAKIPEGAVELRKYEVDDISL